VPAGYEHTRGWLADVRAHADPQLSCILVGNKTDLCGEEPEPKPTLAPADAAAADADAPAPPIDAAPAPARAPAAGGKARAVPRAEAAAWAEAEGLLFAEASARSGAGVERAFVDACVDILRKVRDGRFDDGRVRVVRWLAGDVGSPVCRARVLSRAPLRRTRWSSARRRPKAGVVRMSGSDADGVHAMDTGVDGRIMMYSTPYFTFGMPLCGESGHADRMRGTGHKHM
jgi:hypothetical protein